MGCQLTCKNIYSTALHRMAKPKSPYYSSAPHMITPPLSKNHKNLSDDSQESRFHASEGQNPRIHSIFTYTRLATFPSRKIPLFEAFSASFLRIILRPWTHFFGGWEPAKSELPPCRRLKYTANLQPWGYKFIG